MGNVEEPPRLGFSLPSHREIVMIPHRPPDGIPVHLLDPAEHLALQGEAIDWSRHLVEETTRAAFNLTAQQREQVRDFGMVFRRHPVNRGPLDTQADERLGREVLNALAKRHRRDR